MPILLNKPPGLTPLQALALLPPNETYSYAGRLDPMAEGLLLVLVGDENKDRSKYLDLQKTYEFEILIGVASDTYDVMGRITQTSDDIVSSIPKISGAMHLPYPPFSSKTVNGKPLFWYAKNNLLETITIPTKEITINNFTVREKTTLINEAVHTSIKNRINLVHGEFRQAEILADWQNFFDKKTSREMTIYRCSATVTSGTYIRSLINKISQDLKIPMLAYSIKRTAVGPYSLNDGTFLGDV